MSFFNKYALDLNGATYLSNNNLDVTQDFSVIVKLKIPQPKTYTGDSTVDNQIIIGGQVYDVSGNNVNQMFFEITSASINTLQYGFRLYNSNTGSPAISLYSVDIQSKIGDTVTAIICSVGGYMKVYDFNNDSIHTDSTQQDTTRDNINTYLYGAQYRDFGGGAEVLRYCKDTNIIEILELQDTLTDSQLLEFATLDKLSDHSDYSTFNKNAYYDFDTQTTDDQSGGNDATETGIEQYAIIESATESGAYLKLNYPLIDPNWRQTNSNGTPKAPINWLLDDVSEVDRFKESGSFIPYWYTMLFYDESLSIPFKTSEVDKLYIGTCTFSVYIVSPNPTSSFKIQYNSTQSETFTSVATEQLVNITFDLKSNMDYMKFSILVDGDIFTVFTDLTFNVQSLPVPITTEFANFTIDTKQVSSVTIANTLSTRKTGKTEKAFESELIVSPEQNESMLQVLDITRANKKLTDIYINAVEMAGKTIATNPESSGFEQYYFQRIKSVQKTGVYNYITVSYLNNQNNGVY
ncbi:MAG: hypothetical protein GY928_37475 [Colwellia sp.]|nr:hypothetical protein [Colwellia sp.]